MNGSSGRFWWGFPVIIIVLVIIVIWCCWFKPCPPTVPATEAASMTVADHGGLWMPIDNEATKPDAIPFDQWPDKRAGFLVQLGIFYRLDGNGMKVAYNETNYVLFEAPNQPAIKLFPGQGKDFEWISIVGKYAGKPQHPIDRKYADGLYPASYNGATPTFCTSTELCPHGAPPATGAPALGCADTINKLPQPCLRMRSLHAYFEPRAIITYFQGPHGYDVRVREEAGSHIDTEFVFKDGFDVYVYKDGAEDTAVETQINALGPELVVKVIEPAVQPHEATHDPPTGPKPQ